MSLNISSETIDNPLLIDLLRQLNHTFSKIGSDFFVTGATARDIILRVLANTSAQFTKPEVKHSQIKKRNTHKSRIKMLINLEVL